MGLSHIQIELFLAISERHFLRLGNKHAGLSPLNFLEDTFLNDKISLKISLWLTQNLHELLHRNDWPINIFHQFQKLFVRLSIIVTKLLMVVLQGILPKDLIMSNPLLKSIKDEIFRRSVKKLIFEQDYKLVISDKANLFYRQRRKIN